jgi:RNA polymerase sigma factor (TIGR02999 family)
VFRLVYDELHAIAHKQRRAWHGDLTLGTTALVHEAYLKLVGQRRIAAESRAHFLGIAAKSMRHVLCNHAKSRTRQKRGGDVEHVTLDTDTHAASIGLSDEQRDTLQALDDALRKLERLDKRQSEIVECRFFGGMSIEDTALALGVSPATVKRQWTLARAWLFREMRQHIASSDA